MPNEPHDIAADPLYIAHTNPGHGYMIFMTSTHIVLNEQFHVTGNDEQAARHSGRSATHHAKNA